MSGYSAFDYLCDEPFAIPGIGHVNCPTLRNIRHITYRIFSLYLNLLNMSYEDYLLLPGADRLPAGQTDTPSDAGSLFSLLLSESPSLLLEMFNFFLTEGVLFDDASQSFLTYDSSETGEPLISGCIGIHNFDSFRKDVMQILGIHKPSAREGKCKSKKARELLQKIEQAKKSLSREAKKDSAFTLDNMVKKYCTHNKVGINILNVWDMTFRQFQEMFQEYQFARQADYHDSLAANTFSYKEVSDYKPSLWLEQITDT